MSREEKIAKARELRAEGLTYKQIGAEIGVSITTVCEYLTGKVSAKVKAWKEAHPERVREHNLARNEQKREWDRSRADDCSECGRRLSAPGHLWCRECEKHRREAEGRARTERFIDLRRQGLTNREIAKREGVPEYVVGHTFHRAHRYDLEVPPPPYWSRKKAAA